MRTLDGTVEQVLARIATSNKGIASREELLAAGLSRNQIRRRTRKGVLIPEYPGVYRVGHSAPSVQASYLAALKACGEGAVLSGLAAAYLYELIKGKPPAPEVTARTKRKLPGVITHRARASIEDASEYDGIPVTTMPRTLVDIAPKLEADALARAVHQAAVRFHTKIGRA